MAAWPEPLAPLLGVEAARAYLGSIEITSVDLCFHIDDTISAALRAACPGPGPAAAALEKLLEVVAAFQRWDADGNGSLDYHELDVAINRTFSREMIGMLLGASHNLQDRFDAIDTNRDGKISFGEFYSECCKDARFFGLIKNKALSSDMKVMVACPAGMGPGQQLHVDPDGPQGALPPVLVTIPDGVVPGQQFEVTIPQSALAPVAPVPTPAAVPQPIPAPQPLPQPVAAPAASPCAPHRNSLPALVSSEVVDVGFAGA